MGCPSFQVGGARMCEPPQLATWALLRALDDKRASPLARLADDVLRDPLAAPSVPLLVLLLRARASRPFFEMAVMWGPPRVAPGHEMCSSGIH